MINCKVLDTCRDILYGFSRPADASNNPDLEPTEHDLIRLKRGTIRLMISILEGARGEEVFKKVVNSLDFELLRTRMCAIYENYVETKHNIAADLVSPEYVMKKMQSPVDDSLHAGFDIFIIMSILAEKSDRARNEISR